MIASGEGGRSVVMKKGVVTLCSGAGLVVDGYEGGVMLELAPTTYVV